MSENPIMDQVQESEENEVLYEQLRESYKLLKTKHQNKVNEWINSLTRIEINACETPTSFAEKEELEPDLLSVGQKGKRCTT